MAALLALTLVAYSNSLHTPLLLDNDEIILKDPRVHAVTSVQLHRIWTQQYWETARTGLYRPLTTLSFLFNYAVLGNGSDPYGYHWFNLLLHAVNIMLVYALGLAIFEQVSAAFLVGAIWAVHPALTEAVTNIVGRSDMLAAFGVLAALFCHRQALTATGLRRVGWMGAILLAVAVGIFSKESGIVVVAILAIYDFTYGRGASWRSRLPSYAAAAIPCVAYLYLRAAVLANSPYIETPFSENPLLGVGFWTARITAVKVVGRYLGLLVWPARLSWDYGYNEIPLFGWSLTNWEDWKAAGAFLMCVALVILAIRSYKRRPPVFFAVAFFFAALSPTSNLVVLIGTPMGERFLYLPAVGFAIAVGWALSALWQLLPKDQPNYRYIAGGALGVILIALISRTYDRNGDWLDPQRFWLSAAQAAPGSYKANMAAAANTFLATEDNVGRSIHYADRALAILDGLPDSRNAATAYSDAAIFYRNLGDLSASKDRGAGGPVAPTGSSANTTAQYWFRKSLNALLRSERIELASDARYRAENAKHGWTAVTSLPSKLYLELGRAYMRLSDTQHALAAYERGRALESSPDLLEELASVYRAHGDPRKAALALVEALAMDPNRSYITSTLVELYGQMDPSGCAVTHGDGEPSLNTDCPLVHADICASSRNVIGNYLRRSQTFEADYIRRVAEHDLGCAPGLLN